MEWTSVINVVPTIPNLGLWFIIGDTAYRQAKATVPFSLIQAQYSLDFPQYFHLWFQSSIHHTQTRVDPQCPATTTHTGLLMPTQNLNKQSISRLRGTNTYRRDGKE